MPSPPERERNRVRVAQGSAPSGMLKHDRGGKFEPLQAVDLPDGCETTITIGDFPERSVGQGGFAG